MYLDHFKLDRPPFQSKPDPDFLYLSKAHARAKEYLDYTVWNQSGMAVITGEIGCGKSTLINHLLRRLGKDTKAVLIRQTQLDEEQFLQILLSKFGIEDFNANKAKLLTLLETFFTEQHQQGRNVLLVVDEAQHLAPEVLEEIRLLTGIEIEGEYIFNCILMGHYELMDTLDGPGMEQLFQRIHLRFHIPKLSDAETLKYIYHRLKIAGCDEPSKLFPEFTLPPIYEYTGGVPRLINILCDAALIAAYAEDSNTVTIELIETAIEELQWVRYKERRIKSNRDELKPVHSVKPSTLILSHDDKVIEEIPLDKIRITLGRHITNNVVLGHRLVSKHHAEILRPQGEVVIEDMGSRNGTYVNGRRVKRSLLRNGDRINIGPYELQYIDRETVSDSNEVTELRSVPINFDRR